MTFECITCQYADNPQALFVDYTIVDRNANILKDAEQGKGIVIQCPNCGMRHYVDGDNNPSLKEIIDTIKGTVK